MREMEMHSIIAEAAVALQEAKEQIQELQYELKLYKARNEELVWELDDVKTPCNDLVAEINKLTALNDELNCELDDYKYIHKCAQDDLRDAERRIQFLEKML